MILVDTDYIREYIKTVLHGDDSKFDKSEYIEWKRKNGIYVGIGFVETPTVYKPTEEDIKKDKLREVVSEANNLYFRMQDALIATNAARISDSTPKFHKSSTIIKARLVEAAYIITITYGKNIHGSNEIREMCLEELADMISRGKESEKPGLKSQYQFMQFHLKNLVNAANRAGDVNAAVAIAIFVAEHSLCEVKQNKKYYKVVKVISDCVHDIGIF